MVRLLRLIVCCLGPAFLAAHAAEVEVLGAGSSFSAPVLEDWARAYPGQGRVHVSYRAVGSGEGIRLVTERAVDFAMSDVPLTPAELQRDDLVQFPLVAGAIVPVVNLPGVRTEELRLDGAVLAGLFLGTITRWNDAAITSLNPDLRLPDLPVRIVHRGDGSGTSFVFTYFLSAVSTPWRERLGVGSRLKWPAGVAAIGNAGVVAAVRASAGSIGYAELAHALGAGVAIARLANRAGRYPGAGDAGVRAALAAADWTRPGYYQVPVNQGGDEALPIVGVSFALIHAGQERREPAASTVAFLRWAREQGGAAARALHYVPIEDAGLARRIEASLGAVRYPGASVK